MLLALSDVLRPEVAARLCTMLPGSAEEVRDMAATVVDALLSHPLFVLGVQPRSLSQPAFRRYDEGSESSPCVADAIVGGIDGIRADVGVIVFLSDPSSYEGGDLVSDTGYGEERYKERAGGCVVYPASARSCVARVTRGARWTAELWAQSLVRHPAQREILYDVGCSLHLLELFESSKSADVDRLGRCHQNLLRLWSQP